MIPRPKFPPSENFTGIALPPLAELSVGALLTGEKNPRKA